MELGIRTKAVQNAQVAGSITVLLPDHQADDFLLIGITNDQGSTSLVLDNVLYPGWTELTTQVNARGTRTAVFWKFATSSSEVDPVVTGSTQSMCCIAIAEDGVDPVGTIHAFSQNDVTSASRVIITNGVTTTEPGCQVYSLAGGYDSNQWSFVADPEYRFLDRAQSNSVKLLATVNGKTTPGLTNSVVFRASVGDGGTGVTVAVKKLNPAIEYTSNLSTLGSYRDLDSVPENWTFLTLGSKITSIAGIDVETDLINSVGDRGMTNVSYPDSTELRFDQAANFWQIGYHAIPSFDATLGLMSITLACPNAGLTGEEGLIVVFLDANDNWAAFNIENRDRLTTFFGFTLFLTSDSTPLDSSGVLDWTNITQMGYGWKKRGNSTTARGVVIRDLLNLGPTIFSGGSSEFPVSPSSVSLYIQPDGVINQFSLQGSGQALMKRSLSIGDGISDVYWKSTTQSLETPSKEDTEWRPSENSVTLEINATASSVIDFSSSVTRTTSKQLFTINPSSSGLATYNFLAASIIGFGVVWNDSVDCEGASFINSSIFTAGAAKFDGCSFLSSISTTHALTIDPNSEIINSSFEKGLEDYALLISQVGTYDLTGTSFSGYTNELNITALTGTVTIKLSPSDTVPNFITAGAAVVFDNAVQTNLQLTSLGNLTEVRVYDSGTVNEIDGEESITTGTFSTVIPNTINVVDIHIISLGFQNLFLKGITTDVDKSIPITQTIDRQYENN